MMLFVELFLIWIWIKIITAIISREYRLPCASSATFNFWGRLAAVLYCFQRQIFSALLVQFRPDTISVIYSFGEKKNVTFSFPSIEHLAGGATPRLWGTHMG